MPRAEPWRYEKLTWPEINEAVGAGRVVVCPVGSTEQHGPHLPLDVDVVCPCGIAAAAARRIPEEVLVMPPFVHGYAAHVMDFPGTTNIPLEALHRLHCRYRRQPGVPWVQEDRVPQRARFQCPNLDLAARRVNLETDAEWHRLFLVAPARRGPGIHAQLAGEPLSRRHCPRLRAGDFRLPVPGRGQRAQGAHRGRRDRLPPVRLRLSVYRPVRPRTGDADLLDRVVQRFGGARSAIAGDEGKGPAGGGGGDRGNWHACSPSSACCRSRRAATTTGRRRACRCRGGRARRRPPAAAYTGNRRPISDICQPQARGGTVPRAPALPAPALPPRGNDLRSGGASVYAAPAQ